MTQKFALCIGINDYPGTGSDLSGCVNDANDWSEALNARGFKVSKLLDRQATGSKMRKSIADVITSASKGDSIVIQFSGHGSFVPDVDGDEADGTDECLCPYDVVKHGVITDDEISEMFAARASGVRLVFIADSCHSGTVARFAPISTPPTTKGKTSPQRIVRFLPPATFMPKNQLTTLGVRAMRPASPPGRHNGLLMSGCRDVEYSYDAWFDGRPNGAFTFVALNELAKLPSSATYKSWYAAIKKVLPSRQYAQSPNLYGTASMKNWKVFV
jgi:metacaspase-1